MPRSEFSQQKQQDIVYEALNTSFAEAADNHRVSVSTIRRWQRKHRIRRALNPSQQGGRGTSVRGGSEGELPHMPTLSPRRQLHKAMDDAAARFAAKRLKWFDGRRRHRRAVKELDAIISQWERDHRESIRENDGGVRSGGTGQSRSTRRSVGSEDRGRKSAPRSSDTRRVYVFDVTPLAELAADDPDAWGFLRKLVDGGHEMVVPEAVIVETNARINSRLRAVLGCKYVKRIALDGHDERTTRMLCERAGGDDIVHASVVVAASNCLASLRKRYTRGCWILEVVTCDLDDIRQLVEETNLEPLAERPYRDWRLLQLARSRSRTIRPVQR